MKKINIILLLILIAGCNNRTEFTDVGKATLNAIIKNDTNDLKELFFANMDSMEINEKSKLFNDILKYKDKNYSFIKTDTSSFDIYSIDYVRINYLETYFQIDTNYYLLSSQYEKNEDNLISIYNVEITDLTESCKNWASTPYCPKNEIKFGRINWISDYWNTSFKAGKIELTNLTGNDIDYVKFRVILKNNYQIFFNQTVIYNKKIFAGDITTIDIPGMVDFFTGFTIDKDRLQFNAELIEVLPKPESFECKKIQELKVVK